MSVIKPKATPSPQIVSLKKEEENTFKGVNNEVL